MAVSLLHFIGSTSALNYVTISSPSSSASFYYRDMSAGTPTLTASSTDYMPAQTTFTITGVILNPGFESGTNNPWTGSQQNTDTGESPNPHDSYDGYYHSGGYWPETDTAEMDTNTNGYASITQTLTPAIPLTNIPNTAGTLAVYICRAETSNGGDSVEVKLYASTGNYVLHYYWGASAPSDTSTDKYIYMGTVTSLPSGGSAPGSWYLFSRNLYADWTSEELSSALYEQY